MESAIKKRIELDTQYIKKNGSYGIYCYHYMNTFPISAIYLKFSLFLCIIFIT